MHPKTRVKEREGGREAPPKMDRFQGRYQDGVPMIVDPDVKL